MKKIFLFCCLVLNIGFLVAQTNYVEKGKHYSLARIYPRNGGVFRASDFQMINDSVVTFTRIGSTVSQNMNVLNMNFVSVKSGSMALPYGLYGAGLGLLSALYGISNVKADPALDDSKVNWTPFVAGFTAGFGLLGTFIGALTPKWKRLYMPNHSTSYSFSITPELHDKYNGVRLIVKF